MLRILFALGWAFSLVNAAFQVFAVLVCEGYLHWMVAMKVFLRLKIMDIVIGIFFYLY